MLVNEHTKYLSSLKILKKSIGKLSIQHHVITSQTSSVSPGNEMTFPPLIQLKNYIGKDVKKSVTSLRFLAG